MKVLSIDYCYYKFPENISDLDEFLNFIESSTNKFIKLDEFQTENCVPPYYILEETLEVSLNISQMRRICAEDIIVLARDEYKERLQKVVNEKCKTCDHYFQSGEGDNLDGHWGKISLDGECCEYENECDKGF